MPQPPLPHSPPAQPSPQDQRVAAQAQQDINQARAELAQERNNPDPEESDAIAADDGPPSPVETFDPTPEDQPDGAAGLTGVPGARPQAATPEQVSAALSEAALLGNGETAIASAPRIDPGRLFSIVS